MERETKTILVVDDEPMLVSIYVRALEQHGYRVLTALSGEDALGVIETHDGPIDLLLSDIVMPGMGGRELVWRARELLPGMRVILASGYADAGGALQLIESGEVLFLEKPVDFELLIARVREAIGGPPH